eukprot:gene4906-6117_t
MINKLLENKNIKIIGTVDEEYSSLVTVESVEFIASIAREFEAQRQQLLRDRIAIQSKINSTAFQLKQLPSNNGSPRNNADWRVASIPKPLLDRKADIVCQDVTNIDVLTSCMMSKGASGIQVDFDDGYSPTWLNGLRAHQNLVSVIVKNPLPVDYQVDGSKRALPLLLPRPRSLNLDEVHLLVDGSPVAGAFFDIGLFSYHCAKKLVETERGPYFYIPKLENHMEARLWAKVLEFIERKLEIPLGTIRVIVLIENILAAYEMEEIMFELKDYIVALNTGRWDYIFSFIKKFSDSPDHQMPGRSFLGLDQPFLKSYYNLLVSHSHRRGCLATAGMAPQHPGLQSGAVLNEQQLIQVYNGKKVEAQMGFDGALVAHPTAVTVCRDAFDSVIGKMRPNTLSGSRSPKFNPLESVQKIQELSLVPQGGYVTEKDVESSLYILYHYISSWLKGQGALPLNGVMEDLATAEINRALLWKWLRFSSKLHEGSTVSLEMIQKYLTQISSSTSQDDKEKEKIAKLIFTLLLSQSFIDFMPTLLYPQILTIKFKSNL